MPQVLLSRFNGRREKRLHARARIPVKWKRNERAAGHVKTSFVGRACYATRTLLKTGVSHSSTYPNPPCPAAYRDRRLWSIRRSVKTAWDGRTTRVHRDPSPVRREFSTRRLAGCLSGSIVHADANTYNTHGPTLWLCVPTKNTVYNNRRYLTLENHGDIRLRRYSITYRCSVGHMIKMMNILENCIPI